MSCFFFLMIRRPPSSTLFPPTPLFRSVGAAGSPSHWRNTETLCVCVCVCVCAGSVGCWAFFVSGVCVFAVCVTELSFCVCVSRRKCECVCMCLCAAEDSSEYTNAASLAEHTKTSRHRRSEIIFSLPMHQRDEGKAGTWSIIKTKWFLTNSELLRILPSSPPIITVCCQGFSAFVSFSLYNQEPVESSWIIMNEGLVQQETCWKTTLVFSSRWPSSRSSYHR